MPRSFTDYPVTVSESSEVSFPVPSKAVYRCIIKCKVVNRPDFVGVYNADTNFPKMWSGYYYVLSRNCVIDSGSINFTQSVLYDETTQWSQEASIRAYSTESLTPDPDVISIIDELAFIASYGNVLPEPLTADVIAFTLPRGVVLQINFQYIYYDDIENVLGDEVAIPVPSPLPDPNPYPVPTNPNASPDMAAFCAANYPSPMPSIGDFIDAHPDYFGRPYAVLVNTGLGYNLLHRRVMSKSGIFSSVAMPNCFAPGSYYSAETLILCNHCAPYGVSSINILYTDGLPAKTKSGYIVANTCGNVVNTITSAALE